MLGPEELRHVADEGIRQPVLVSMVAGIRKMRIDWTVPSTWIIGIFFMSLCSFTGFVIQWIRIADSVDMLTKNYVNYVVQYNRHIEQQAIVDGRQDNEITRHGEFMEGTERRVTRVENIMDAVALPERQSPRRNSGQQRGGRAPGVHP